jgi:hypothetical protein
MKRISPPIPTSPGDVRGEGAADQRAENRRDPKYGTKEALVLGPFVQRNSVDNNDDLMQHGVSKSKFDEKHEAAQRKKGKRTTPD